jgi:hypothetical protein
MKRRVTAMALAFLFVACAFAPAAAQTKPDEALLQSMLHAGGSPKFSSVTLFDVLTGNKETAELVTLTRKFGALNVRAFFYTFDSVISDALKRQGRVHTNASVKPAPDPEDGRALAAALYAAGNGNDNHFDTTRMFDRLFTKRVREGLIKDAARRANVHTGVGLSTVLTQLMNDLKTQYSL